LRQNLQVYETNKNEPYEQVSMKLKSYEALNSHLRNMIQTEEKKRGWIYFIITKTLLYYHLSKYFFILRKVLFCRRKFTTLKIQRLLKR
jgi:hypothetical protein